MKQRKRVRSVVTKIDPEAEELNQLSSEIRKNREKHALQQLMDNYRHLFAAVCQKMQEDEAAAQAEEQRSRKLERKYRFQMRKLANRVLLCLAIGFGVILSWWVGLVRWEFLLGVCCLCACVISFTIGSGREKSKQFGGARR